MRTVLSATLLGLTLGVLGLIQASPAGAADELQIGSVAVVSGTDGAGLRLREAPGTTKQVLAVLKDGERGTVLSGPMKVDGFDWYQLKTSTRTGWSRGAYLKPADSVSKSSSTPVVQAASATTTIPIASTSGTRTINAKVTAYATGNPGVGTRTATGTTVQWGTVSVDPRVIPFGSQMLIEGFGDKVFTAEDRGSAVIGNMVDIFFPDAAAAGKFATSQRKVTIIREGYGR